MPQLNLILLQQLLSIDNDATMSQVFQSESSNALYKLHFNRTRLLPTNLIGDGDDSVFAMDAAGANLIAQIDINVNTASNQDLVDLGCDFKVDELAAQSGD